MTFVDDTTNVASDKIAVGFYVNSKQYKHFQDLAQELYNEKVPTGDGGQSRMLESPDVNQLVLFSVTFFEQNYKLFKNFSKQENSQNVLQSIFNQITGGVQQPQQPQRKGFR